MDTLDVLRLLAVNAYALYRASLHGGRDQMLFNALTHPQPGDVVLETSTIYRWRAAPGQGLGVLLRVADEPFPRADNLEPDPEARERVWYIRPLDNSVPELRWTNAHFIRVLTDPVS